MESASIDGKSPISWSLINRACLEFARRSESDSSFSDDSVCDEIREEEFEADREHLFEMEVEVLDTRFFPLTAAPEEVLCNPIFFGKGRDKEDSSDEFDTWLGAIGAVYVFDSGPQPSPPE